VPQGRSGHCGVQRNLLTLPSIEPRSLGRPARSPVAIQTELSQKGKCKIAPMIKHHAIMTYGGVEL
jgi:hypothetical protein